MGIFDDFFGGSKNDKIQFDGKEYNLNKEAMLFSQKGLDCYKVGNRNEAIQWMDKAIQVQPTNQNFYTIRGTMSEEIGLIAESERDFKKAIELSPNDFVALYRLGMTYFNTKRHSEALKPLMSSYQNAPDVDLDHLGMGKNTIFFVAKKVVAANLGNLLVQLGRTEEGITYLDVAINLDPNYSNPYMTKGLALIQLGRNSEGVNCFEKAKELGDTGADRAISVFGAKTMANSGTKPNSIEAILEAGKNYAESEHVKRLTGGLRYCDVFMKDIGQVVLSQSEYKTLMFSDLVEIMIDYNLEMWQAYRKNDPNGFDDKTKAMISHEVVLGAKQLNLARFDFMQIYQEVHLKTANRLL